MRTILTGASHHGHQAAYLKLVKQYHPDRFQDEAERAIAQEQFLEVQVTECLALTHSLERTEGRQHSDRY